MSIFQYLFTRDFQFFGRIIVLLWLLSLSPLSLADCESLITQLGSELEYPDGTTYEASDLSACKALPTDQTQSIIAFANLQKSPSPVDSLELYDLDVLLVKNESGKILERLFRKSAFQPDALVLSGIVIDTARYHLAPKMRAFGITASYESHSRSYIANISTANLYAPKDQSLTEVLTNLVIYNYSGTGGAEMDAAGDSCTSTVTEIKRTLSIEKTSTNGYADILITEKSNQSESKLVKNDCKTTSSASTKRYALRFDGNVYVVPKELLYQ